LPVACRAVSVGSSRRTFAIFLLSFFAEILVRFLAIGFLVLVLGVLTLHVSSKILERSVAARTNTSGNTVLDLSYLAFHR